ncbi:hypothetical protein BDD12DRAFT_914526 [Trichophaea hybrida]|nr:hypothetical protein BDD12DRAFT_914526 [Trichophaea hybrida]
MDRIVKIVLATTLTYFAHAQPIQGVEPAWKAEPRGRGTLGIVLPCVITLGLCVWTAIHLNVNTRPTVRRLLAFKAVWVFMGMFTPELVLWCSLSQYLQACVVRKEILDIRSGYNADRLPPTMWQKCLAFLTRRTTQKTTVDDFSMKMAFFVIMGGYALDFAPEDPRVVAKPITSGDSLNYKAKADALAKFIWLVVQGIGRLISGLPLPLLELHTIMHVLCAVAMYGFWWYKPMDVRHPIDLGEKISEFRDALRDDRPDPTSSQLHSSTASSSNGAVPTQHEVMVTATPASEPEESNSMQTREVEPISDVPHTASGQVLATSDTYAASPPNGEEFLLATMELPTGEIELPITVERLENLPQDQSTTRNTGRPVGKGPELYCAE